MYKSIGPSLAQDRIVRRMNKVALSLLSLAFIAAFIRYALMLN